MDFAVATVIGITIVSAAEAHGPPATGSGRDIIRIVGHVTPTADVVPPAEAITMLLGGLELRIRVTEWHVRPFTSKLREDSITESRAARPGNNCDAVRSRRLHCAKPTRRNVLAERCQFVGSTALASPVHAPRAVPTVYVPLIVVPVAWPVRCPVTRPGARICNSTFPLASVPSSAMTFPSA